MPPSIRFHDPEAQFMLEFEVEDPADLTQDLDAAEAASLETVQELVPSATAAQPSETGDVAAEAEGPKVVSLDQFRKK